MKKKFLLGLFLAVVLTIVSLGIGMVAEANSQANEPQHTEQVQYKDMGDQLLSEFLVFHQEYTPQNVVKRCKLDPNWKLLGVEDMSGFRWIVVRIPNGIYSFGYTGDSLQPQVVSFIPAAQNLEGQSVDSAVKALVEEAKKQFKRAPDRVVGNLIVYHLKNPASPNGISATIFVGQDGTYAVATGLNKYIKLPPLEDA